MDTTILTRENESSSIEKLVAQRELYSFAKIIFYIQISISVISLVLLSFAQLIFSKVDFELIIATFSLFAVIANIYLEHLVSNLKEKSSKIQELFDTYVLNIKWNHVLCREKPEYNEIFYYYSKCKTKNNLSKLKNWYDKEIANVPEQIGKIICQKTNCTYDSSIRKKYNDVVLIIGISTILLILIFTIFSGISLSKIILTFIFPSVPIIQWVLKNIMDNNKSIKNLEILNNLINETWTNLKNRKVVDDNIIRQIQDGIFINRKTSTLIPDFVYNILRDKLEKQTSYSVGELINEINRQ